jgi:hypothetical protein
LNDIDGDGLTNDVDLDDDGDGIADAKDPDRDGDGVDNDLDAAPDDPTVTGMLGMLPLGALGVQALALRLDFATAGKDSITMKGVLPVAAGFVPGGVQADVDVGGQTRSFVLDARGRGVNGSDQLALKVGRRRDAHGFLLAAFKLAMKRGSFVVEDTGGAPLDGSAPGTADRSVKATLTLDGASAQMRYAVKTLVYKSTATSGKAKNKKP